MKVSIRPAPHSKGCAVAGREWCGKFDNHSERCETECPAGYCCEMKHCWEVGEKLEKILIARGHEVKMADKKYRKGYPSGKASENTIKAMQELMAWAPDVHVAIHTNASGNGKAYGVRIGYPQKRSGSNAERLAASRRLADCVVDEEKKIYYAPDRVSATDGYNFYELNHPACPAVYVEGCFANDNLSDAQWWHNNMDAIAKSYADALEKWWVSEGNALPVGAPEEDMPAPAPGEEVQETMYTARKKNTFLLRLNLWSDAKKSKSLAVIGHGEDVQLLSMEAEGNYYPAVFKGLSGYVDKRYVTVVAVSSEKPAVYLRKKNTFLYRLNLWSDAQKSKSLKVIKAGAVMELLSEDVVNGYSSVRYDGTDGWVDVRYVERVS